MPDVSGLRERLKEQYPRYRHWEIFKIFETDLSTVSRYINICENNFSTHSAELSSLILRISTEVEILRKRMTEAADNGTAASRLFELYPDICNVETTLPLWSLTFCPWKGLPNAKPDWWIAYESIKHDNSTSIAHGNLEYFLKALSGLYVLLLYYDRLVYSNKDSRGNDVIIFEYNSTESLYFSARSKNLSQDISGWGNHAMTTWLLSPKS